MALFIAGIKVKLILQRKKVQEIFWAQGYNLIKRSRFQGNKNKQFKMNQHTAEQGNLKIKIEISLIQAKE